jgi:hypothetical protein
MLATFAGHQDVAALANGLPHGVAFRIGKGFERFESKHYGSNRPSSFVFFLWRGNGMSAPPTVYLLGDD